MRRWILVVVVVLVGWVASTSVASAAVWTQTTPQRFYPDLVGVGASSSTDVWAVGENDADFETPIAEHWNGTAWGPGNFGYVLYNLRPYDGGLLGVSALSGSDAWAVGWQDTPGTGALAMFWDGSSWSVVSTPASSSGTRRLDSVSMLTRSNVWAVGEQGVGTLAEHWNGTRWSVATTPGTGALTSVKAVSASNVWAVGGHVIEHYNGTKWAIVSVPVTSTTELSQVTRISGTNHLWAVGTDTATGTPVAPYYDGTSWKAHNPPGSGRLDGVAALSSTDVWASGESPNGNNTKNLTVHWTGTAWHTVSPVGLANGWVENMTRAPGSNQLWAVGMDLTNDGPFAAYYH